MREGLDNTGINERSKGSEGMNERGFWQCRMNERRFRQCKDEEKVYIMQGRIYRGLNFGKAGTHERNLKQRRVE